MLLHGITAYIIILKYCFVSSLYLWTHKMRAWSCHFPHILLSVWHCLPTHHLVTEVGFTFRQQVLHSIMILYIFDRGRGLWYHNVHYLGITFWGFPVLMSSYVDLLVRINFSSALSRYSCLYAEDINIIMLHNMVLTPVQMLDDAQRNFSHDMLLRIVWNFHI
jgi:hypothetical protein